jgi:hypothetical protein
MPRINDLEKRAVTHKYHIRSWYENRFPGLTHDIQDLVNERDIINQKEPEMNPSEVPTFWEVRDDTGPEPPQPLENAQDASPENHPIVHEMGSNPNKSILKNIDEPEHHSKHTNETTKRKYKKKTHTPTSEYALRKQVTIGDWSKEHQVVFPTDETPQELPGGNDATGDIDTILKYNMENNTIDVYTDKNISDNQIQNEINQIEPTHVENIAKYAKAMGAHHLNKYFLQSTVNGIQIHIQDLAMTPPEKGAKAQIKTKYWTKKTTENFISISEKEINPTPNERIHVRDMESVPQSVTEALKSKYRQKWIDAMISEYRSLKTMGVWEIADLPEGRRALKSKRVFAYKQDGEGYLTRFKARLVAAGYSQIEGVDYNEIFSPVVKIQTVRLIVALAIIMHSLEIEQIDISTAFLYGDLEEPNYMKMPEGFIEYDENRNAKICKLKKNLYGLHQASRQWAKKLATHLKSMSFDQCKSDSCVFIKNDKTTKKVIFVLVYVDDMMLVSNSRELIQDIKQTLKLEFELKDMGLAQYLFGLKLERTKNGLWLGQPTYTETILKEMGMWNVAGSNESIQTKPNPMAPTWVHDTKRGWLTEDEKSKFISIVMKLSYLAQQTRPDILFAVNKLAQYQNANPTKSDWGALIRILRYLRKTWDLGLHYKN